MSLSFNEIEGAAYKAARGAGFAWGLAEEAGYAARWLAERGIDWLPAFLEACEAQETQRGGEVSVSGRRVRPGGSGSSLCPILVGAWLADEGVASDGLEILDLRQPVLLLPFLDLASRRSGPIAASVLPASGQPAQTLRVCSGRLRADPLRLLDPTVATVIVEIATGARVEANVARLSRPRPLDMGCIARLNAYEHRTYVPASDRSRLAGAGAGLTDND